MSRRLAVGVQAMGLVAVAVGFGLWALWVGVVVGGAGLIVAGLVAELGAPD